MQLLGLTGSAKELLAIVLIVLVPTVPAALYARAVLGRRRGRAHGVESGRAPETPFVVIAYVSTVAAVVAVLALLLAVAVRAAAT